MTKRTLISVVEDDQPFRESMRKLMTALGYTVEAFPRQLIPGITPIAATCLVTDVRCLNERLSSTDISSIGAT
jgi:FixJ family two-component response regulator